MCRTVTLRLAEFEQSGEQEMSVYAQGNRAHDSGYNGRSFSIAVNGTAVADSLHLPVFVATEYTLPVTAQDGQGIIVTFTAQQGKTLLNAIDIVRQ